MLGCAVSIRSMLDHAEGGEAIRFHVVTRGIDDEDRDAIERTVLDGPLEAEVAFRPFDTEPVSNLTRSRLITHTAYARLFLGELLPADVKRCVYVDCDLVFARNVGELWRTDLEGRTAGAVVNGSLAEAREYQRRLGLREPSYFNSGVLLLDLGRWRRREVGPRALSVADRIGPNLILHDQDALNVALQDDWVSLAPDWNVWVIDPRLTRDSRVVYHYMGAPKPWDPDYDRPFRDLFYRYLDRTPFGGWRPWNPAGIGAVIVRLRRRLPYLPGVVRALRARFGFESD